MTSSPDTLPPLYGLTDPSSGLSLSENADALIQAGLRWIQVRAKGVADDVLYGEIEQIAGALPAGVKLVINDRSDMALACHADGVHLGLDDLPAEAVRRVAGSRPLWIGFSTHSLSDAIAADADAAVDYIALGPIFRSSTKTVREPLGLDLLAEVRAAVTKPIVAIGGIDAANIASVMSAGADSCAVIGGIYAGGAVAENIHRLMEAISAARR